eukprot:TRINITY_DN3907_c1_g1_i1.p1 TRINITY_DN3907_c1_g1~~TRINITY_DN3907_c1_g1_i1.p1  ORF type:complete len:500 (+),score=99.52 TRINITY_DN3907_c1_g1_i1:840-2339(+)
MSTKKKSKKKDLKKLFNCKNLLQNPKFVLIAMLEYFCIFTKGGALLWAYQLSQVLRGDPINNLVKSCLLEERAGETAWTYTPKHGAPYALKWTQNNGLGLVFVAVYQKALTLLYIDELLESVKRDFSKGYKAKELQYKAFDSTFQQLLKECEERAEQIKKGLNQKAKINGVKVPALSNQANQQVEEESQMESSPQEDEDVHVENNLNLNGRSENIDETQSSAFNVNQIKKIQSGKPSGRGPGLRGRGKLSKSSSNTKESFASGKKLRNWGGNLNADQLDASDDKPPTNNGIHEEAVDVGQSRIDLENDDDIEYSDDENFESEDTNKSNGTLKKSQKSSGLLGSFMSTIKMSVVGKQSLSKEDIDGALVLMKGKLMERNVAEPIAAKLCDSVANNLEGKKLASFTGVSSAVRDSFEGALTRILTPKRSIDILGEIRATQRKGQPYVIVAFCLAGNLQNRHGGVRECKKKKKKRSEEHTSELQSRDSLSYAVFCLKKKNII